MKITKRTVITVISVICFIFTSQVWAEVAIIVHKSNSATFTDKEIENIFLMKVTQFPNGEAAKIVIPKDEPKVVEEFAKKVCNRKLHQMQANWKQMLFTGKGQPINVDMDAQVIEKVSSDSQFIGIIDASNTSENVKVVKTY